MDMDSPVGPRIGTVFVPAAVLAALVLPALFPSGDPVVEALLGARFVAGGVATLVAWRTGSMMATIAAGMAVLWAVRFLFG